jgi:hypothetical protein
MAKSPEVGPIARPDQKIHVSQRPEKPRRWVFSFRFWRQIEFFGLDKSQPSWFVSLLDRLAELSELEIDDFRSDPASKRYHRYHGIDWDQKNIPIKREDLTWLEPDYRDNPAEYPLVQFMVSKALGRVVGFWDENDVFCVVLLDPLHNIQPSKYHSYKIDPCSPLSCEYTSLLVDINKIRGQECIAEQCPVRLALDGIPVRERREVIVTTVEVGTADWISSMIASNRAESFADVIEAGIITLDTTGVAIQQPPADRDADGGTMG